GAGPRGADGPTAVRVRVGNGRAGSAGGGARDGDGWARGTDGPAGRVWDGPVDGPVGGSVCDFDRVAAGVLVPASDDELPEYAEDELVRLREANGDVVTRAPAGGGVLCSMRGDEPCDTFSG